MVAVAMVLASRPGWKMTPGERTSWETTTRSVPLMMNVPLSVIIGKSPMKTVCSLISPVVAFMKRARTKIGAEKVMSFSLHSSTVNLGGGRRSWSDAVELQLQAELAGEVLDGTDVAEGFGHPTVEEPFERVSLDGDQVREGQDLVEVGKGKAFPRGGTSGQNLTPSRRRVLKGWAGGSAGRADSRACGAGRVGQSRARVVKPVENRTATRGLARQIPD